jgi:hypothetical protein
MIVSCLEAEQRFVEFDVARQTLSQVAARDAQDASDDRRVFVRSD